MLTHIQHQPFGALFKAGLPDINHDGKIMVKSGLSARPDVGPMPAMFVAAGQAGYMTTANGKEVVVAVYALNGVYPTSPTASPRTCRPPRRCSPRCSSTAEG